MSTRNSDARVRGTLPTKCCRRRRRRRRRRRLRCRRRRRQRRVRRHRVVVVAADAVSGVCLGVGGLFVVGLISHPEHPRHCHRRRSRVVVPPSRNYQINLIALHSQVNHAVCSLNQIVAA